VLDVNKRVQLNMIKITLILVIPTFFIEDKLNYIKGLTGGVLYSILSYKLIIKVVTKSVCMNSVKAGIFTFSNYIIRFIIMGILLISALMYSKTMFVGAVLGILTMKIALYLEIFNKRIQVDDNCLAEDVIINKEEEKE